MIAAAIKGVFRKEVFWRNPESLLESEQVLINVLGVFVNHTKKIISLALCICMLMGCAGAGPKQTGGQLVGGVAGALLGSQFGKGSGRLIGVAVGALGGSYLGGSIGHHFDEKDKELSQQTMSATLEHEPDNKTRGWKNPNNNHAGSFTVTKTETMPGNRVCRDYVHTVTMDGKQENVHGRACRDVRDTRADWRIVEN